MNRQRNSSRSDSETGRAEQTEFILARKLVADLYQRNEKLYWVDFGLSTLLAYAFTFFFLIGSLASPIRLMRDLPDGAFYQRAEYPSMRAVLEELFHNIGQNKVSGSELATGSRETGFLIPGETRKMVGIQPSSREFHEHYKTLTCRRAIAQRLASGRSETLDPGRRRRTSTAPRFCASSKSGTGR